MNDNNWVLSLFNRQVEIDCEQVKKYCYFCVAVGGWDWPQSSLLATDNIYCV